MDWEHRVPYWCLLREGDVGVVVTTASTCFRVSKARQATLLPASVHVFSGTGACFLRDS